ncbi:hypothetical protein [Halomonas sp. TD01]|uniref:hypothetical protein n=1 Tax=Halomonas sp. TD01 TaxID=999141 RepID=UPI000214EC0A|nr:hypothetical protein [Halomonas sp. TD01]EGP21350.1 transposase, IS4 family protein [Halomonas sp. TD01]CAH1043796.1 Transposase [Halomonas sp. TD01]
MPRFKAYSYDQNAMVVINYQDQIQLGTFEHAVHYLIDWMKHRVDSPPGAKKFTAIVCQSWSPSSATLAQRKG